MDGATPAAKQGDFTGAKLIVFIGDQIVALRRDDTPGIPYPDMLDFPGGGREDGETPATCALREAREEIGLALSEDQIVWSNRLDRDGQISWFFVVHLPAGAEARIVFGNEGRGWSLMDPAEFIARDDAIPHFRDQLAQYLGHRDRKNRDEAGSSRQ
ncbi:hypothetical protein PRI8871_01469 [Pseudoprimorskyibacter insulae]|uniref:Nudix hydrolase domain-containing protein n=2 Tax=Pseudoprimorskyibacter insulae TaxID=1695997 RepID=A0A2R8AUF7_9RHOB|nr:hypothetical protein PRI8871_01469 [Pseudoprimorskyibacter insulae]